MAKTITQNSVYLFLEKALFALSSLLLTPFIIKMLGVELWAIWAIFNSVANYFLLAQFGASAAFSKYVAEFNARNEHDLLKKFVCSGFYTLLFIGCVAFLIGLVIVPLLFKKFILDENIVSYTSLFIWYLLSSLFVMVGQVFVSISRGMQRFDVYFWISIASKFVYVLVIVVMLLSGFKIAALVLAFAVSSILIIGLHIFATFRLIGNASLHPKYFEFPLIKKMFAFGIRIQITAFASWASYNVDKLIIARFYDLKYVGFYDIGSRLIMLIRDVPMVFFFVLTPRSSELFAKGRIDEIRHLYLRSSKYICMLSFFILAFLFPLAKYIIQIWLRTEPNQLSVYTFRVILLGAMVNLLTGVGSSIGKGVGKPGYEAIANSIGAITNIGLSLAFILYFGFEGIVWGTTISLFISTIIFIYLINKQISISFREYSKRVLVMPFLLNIGLIFLGNVSLPFIQEVFMAIQNTFFRNVMLVLFNGFVVAVFSITIYLVTNFLSQTELKAIVFKR